MPQYRKLHTKTVESLDINDMPDDFTRLLWLLLPLIVCREGRGMDNPDWIKAKAMPLRSDVPAKRINDAMTWYARREMVSRYEVDGRRYFQIVNWARYQGDTSRESESNYPAQPTLEDGEQPLTNSGVTQELLKTNSCSDAYTNTDAYTDANTESAKSAPSADADLTAILAEWKKLFPQKPQPKPTTATLQRQAKARMKSADFRGGWRAALERVSHSQFCATGGWFDLYWFLKNDDNWRKCAAGNYDGNSNGRNGKPEPYGMAIVSKPVAEGDFVSPDEFFGGAH